MIEVTLRPDEIKMTPALLQKKKMEKGVEEDNNEDNQHYWVRR
jgi:hypothetical protein